MLLMTRISVSFCSIIIIVYAFEFTVVYLYSTIFPFHVVFSLLSFADCETCHKLFFDQCDVHGPPLFTYDSPTPMGVPQRALLTLPQGLVIGRSTTPGAGLGVFNQGQIVPLGMHFGPFDGELSSMEKALESAFSWVVSVKDCSERFVTVFGISN